MNIQDLKVNFFFPFSPQLLDANLFVVLCL